jgi:hypothetical protein
MELFLNSLWLLIAVTAVTAWSTGSVRQKLRLPRKLLIESIALATSLVFLFFAISLTDDLQAAAAAAAGDVSATLCDDMVSNRRDALVWQAAHNSHVGAEWSHAPVTAAPLASLFAPKLEVVARVSPSAIDIGSRPKATPSSGRAPPLFCL